jgi:hypothetical protein
MHGHAFTTQNVAHAELVQVVVYEYAKLRQLSSTKLSRLFEIGAVERVATGD